MTGKHDELVARLDSFAALEPGWYANVGKQTGEKCCGAMTEAAAAIRDLVAEREGLERALAPFGRERWGERLPDDTPMFPAASAAATGITAGDFRKARAALSGRGKA